MVGGQSLLFSRRQIHLVIHLHGIRLNALGHLIQDVDRPMDPTALLRDRDELFLLGCPQAQGAIADGQCGSFGETARLEVPKKLSLRFLALSNAIPNRHRLFGPVLQRPHKNQKTGPLRIQPDVEIDSVGPPIDVALLRKIPGRLSLIIGLSIFFQPHDVGCRKFDHLRPVNRFQGLAEIASRDPLQIQKGAQFVHTRYPA